MPSRCFDPAGRAVACDSTSSLAQWFVGLVAVLALTAGALVVLMLMLKNFFAVDLFDLRTPAHQAIVLGAAAVGVGLCLYYTARFGPSKLG